MNTRYLLAASVMTLMAGAAHAQVYTASGEPYCREFTKVVTIGGRPENAYGRACYQPDGSWQVVSDDIPAAQPVQYNPQYNQVEYLPPAYYPEPIYYPQPVSYRAPVFSSFSLNFNSWDNDRGHGWRQRDWGHGNHGRWNNGHGRGHH